MVTLSWNSNSLRRVLPRNTRWVDLVRDINHSACLIRIRLGVYRLTAYNVALHPKAPFSRWTGAAVFGRAHGKLMTEAQDASAHSDDSRSPLSVQVYRILTHQVHSHSILVA